MGRYKVIVNGCAMETYTESLDPKTQLKMQKRLAKKAEKYQAKYPLATVTIEITAIN